MQRRFLYTISFTLLFGVVLGQVPLSLSEAIQKGLENNYQMKITEQSLEIAKNNNSWGAAGMFPSINFGVSQINRFDDSPSRTVENTRQETQLHSFTPNFTMRWNLFNGFSVHINKAKLDNLEEIAKGKLSIQVENTIQDIIMAYYGVVLEKEKLGIVKELRQLSKDRFEYVTVKKEFGSATTYDLLLAKNAYLSDSSNYLVQEINMNNANRNLNLLLAEKEDIVYELSEDFSFEIKNYQLNNLIQKTLSNNHTLKNQYLYLENIKKDIGLKKTSLYPSLSFNSGYDKTYSRTIIDDFDATNSNSYDYYANLSLNISLFNGGSTKRNIQNAKINAHINELMTTELEHVLRNEISRIFEQYLLRKQLFHVAEESLESARLNLQISSDRFKSGAINSFNYRDVQLIYLNNAFARLQSIYQLIQTHTELLRLTGGIIEEY